MVTSIDPCCLGGKKSLLANHGGFPMIISNRVDWSSCLQLFLSCTRYTSALAELQITQKLGERDMEESQEDLRKHKTLASLFLNSTLLKETMFLFSYLCLMPAFSLRGNLNTNELRHWLCLKKLSSFHGCCLLWWVPTFGPQDAGKRKDSLIHSHSLLKTVVIIFWNWNFHV